MWQAIGFVSSGLTLVAFIIAVAAWVFRQHTIKKERLISSAPESERAKLVADALEFFNVDTKHLTKNQQYELAIEQIRARARRFLIACVVVVIVAILAVGVSAFTIMRHYEHSGAIDNQDGIHVFLMDSKYRDVTYDQKAWRESGRTNGNEITEILDDLPGIVLHYEATDLKWEREEQVMKMHPRLIIIHASCFYNTTNLVDADRKFLSFLEYFAKTEVQFLVYSRGFHHGSESWKAALIRQIPELKSRIHVMEVPPAKTFSDPVIRRQLKTMVKEILFL